MDGEVDRRTKRSKKSYKGQIKGRGNYDRAVDMIKVKKESKVLFFSNFNVKDITSIQTIVGDYSNYQF